MPNEDADANPLASYDYEPEEVWAARHGITPRTAARYRNEPDGLPYLKWGGRVFIPTEQAAEYIRSRVKRRNPRRRRSSARNRAEAEARSS